MRPVHVCILPFVLILASMPAVADGGSADDLPGERNLARDVPLGLVAGTLDRDNGDSADWFRVAVPEGDGFRYRLSTSLREVYVYMYDDGGNLLDARFASNWWGDWAVYQPIELVPTGSHLRVGIVHTWGVGSAYELQVDAVVVPDLQLDALTITPVEASALGQPLPGTASRVDVTVSNSGRGEAQATVHITGHHTTSSAVRDIGSATVTLAPGASRSFTFWWDGIGEVGDVTIRASATASTLEIQRENNVRESRGGVIVSGSGWGFDALNTRVQHGGITLGPSYGSGGVGVCALTSVYQTPGTCLRV